MIHGTGQPFATWVRLGEKARRASVLHQRRRKDMQGRSSSIKRFDKASREDATNVEFDGAELEGAPHNNSSQAVRRLLPKALHHKIV